MQEEGSIMMRMLADGALRGEIRIPGDKSVSHRAAIFGALARGRTRIANYAPGEDADDTLKCLRKLGVLVQRAATEVEVCGSGGRLRAPTAVVDCGNSGTTMRLLLGVLAGQDFHAVLSGDSSLASRPMGRVTLPLGEMGADIRGREGGTLAPLSVLGGGLRGASHDLKVASAQVKSALLLAGLYCEGGVTVREPAPSRDHTERMLEHFGATLRISDLTVRLSGGGMQHLRAPHGELRVPGDISSAAFPMIAALLLDGSEVVLRDVGLNPSRTGILRVLGRMGARVQITNQRSWGPEPVGDLRVSHGPLKAVQVRPGEVASLIDEVPVLALLASRARGTSRFRGVGELRVKETDRLAAVVEELGALGIDTEVVGDDLLVPGRPGERSLSGTVDARGDHRMAMTLLLAGLPDGEVRVEGARAIRVSYPGFARDMGKLGVRVEGPPGEAWMGLVGRPVSHSVSPAMFRAAFWAVGLEGWSYQLFETSRGGLSDTVSALRRLRARGFNVTVPHKVSIVPLLDDLDESARLCRAVNTVTVGRGGRLTGYNTDIDGVRGALEMGGFDAGSCSALVLGAGGAARAALAALAGGGAAAVHVANRTAEHAARLIDWIRCEYPGLQASWSGLDRVPGGFDLVVQSTVLGMEPHTEESALPADYPLGPGTTVLEMIYNPAVTPLVRRAREENAAVIAGSEMLVHQGARAFELCTGEAAPLAVMREAVGREIGS